MMTTPAVEEALDAYARAIVAREKAQQRWFEYPQTENDDPALMAAHEAHDTTRIDLLSTFAADKQAEVAKARAEARRETVEECAKVVDEAVVMGASYVCPEHHEGCDTRCLAAAIRALLTDAPEPAPGVHSLSHLRREAIEECAALVEIERERVKHTSHRDGLGMGSACCEVEVANAAAALRALLDEPIGQPHGHAIGQPAAVADTDSPGNKADRHPGSCVGVMCGGCVAMNAKERK